MQKIISRIALLVVLVILVVLVVLVPPPPTTQATVGDVTIDQSVGGSSTLGIVTGQKFVDTASSAYFIDPAATGNALVTAGDATVSGNIALGNTKTLRSAFGPLSLQYKSGLDAWTTGLTLQDTTGNVGIGTTGPDAPLRVQKDLGLGSTLMEEMAFTQLPTGAGNPGMGFGYYVSGGVAVAGYIRPTGALPLYLTNSAGTVVETITNAGNVGIGTTGPGTNLHVVSSSTTLDPIRIQNTSASGYSSLGFFTFGGTGAGGFGYGNTSVAAPLNDRIYFYGNTKDLLFSVDNGATGAMFIQKTSGNVGIGTTSPSTALQVVGTITGTTKNFEIDHPTKPGMKLIHSTVEGPEVTVFYRGESKLADGKAVVALPDYFEALTRKEGRTVQLTAKNGWSPLSVDGEVVHGRFSVKAGSGNPGQQFFWEVKAVRKDVAPLQVEKSVN